MTQFLLPIFLDENTIFHKYTRILFTQFDLKKHAYGPFVINGSSPSCQHVQLLRTLSATQREERLREGKEDWQI